MPVTSCTAQSAGDGTTCWVPVAGEALRLRGGAGRWRLADGSKPAACAAARAPAATSGCMRA